ATPFRRASIPPLLPLTATGVATLTISPFPSWPASLCPQQATVWSESRAHVCPDPAAIAVALVTPVATGKDEPVVLPPPSCPPSPAPQQNTAPFTKRAQL